jgi:hypothetical protein
MFFIHFVAKLPNKLHIFWVNLPLQEFLIFFVSIIVNSIIFNSLLFILFFHIGFVISIILPYLNFD